MMWIWPGEGIIQVEVFATSWIEIVDEKGFQKNVLSRSLRPRGLKYLRLCYNKATFLVEAYVASWIEILYIRR